MTRGSVRVSHAGRGVRRVNRATGPTRLFASGVPAKISRGSPQSGGCRRHWAPSRSRRSDAALPGPDFRSLLLGCRGRHSGKRLSSSRRRGSLRTGAGPRASLGGRSASLVRHAVLGSLRKTCGNEGLSCWSRASRFSEQQGAVVRRRAASRPPLAPARPA